MILLAKVLKQHKDSLDPDFVAHAYAVYNRRWEQMPTPSVRLGLFLHPGYRVVGNHPDKMMIFMKEVCSAKLADLS